MALIVRALAAVLALWLAIPATAAEPRGDVDFDHYLLALSWSPTFCSRTEPARDPLQCAPGRRFAFVVHGLWPQRGAGWPEYCAASARVPERVVAVMLDIMPSPRLIQHQWTKHGTCTGLSPRIYFALTRRMRDAVAIPARYIAPARTIEVTPEQLVADFLASNRGLEPSHISVHCGNRRDLARLRELRICFSLAGAFRRCGADEGRRCRAERLVLPPAR